MTELQDPFTKWLLIWKLEIKRGLSPMFGKFSLVQIKVSFGILHLLNFLMNLLYANLIPAKKRCLMIGINTASPGRCPPPWNAKTPPERGKIGNYSRTHRIKEKFGTKFIKIIVFSSNVKIFSSFVIIDDSGLRKVQKKHHYIINLIHNNFVKHLQSVF